MEIVPILTVKLEEQWGKQLRCGYVIAVEKLMKTLNYSPKVEGMPKEDLKRMKEVMRQQIVRQHNQMFSAAGKQYILILLIDLGYKQWLSRNFGHVAAAEIGNFEGGMTFSRDHI